MTTILLVHGTGVRQKSYCETFERVKAAFSSTPHVAVRPCYWGHLGSDLHLKGASIPKYDSTRALEAAGHSAASEEAYEVALWGVLFDDPLFELRVLAMRGESATEWQPGQLQPGAALATLGAGFPVGAELQDALAAGGIAQQFAAARSTVIGTEACRVALENAPPALAEYRAALARAIVAQACADASPETPVIVYDAALRDRVVDLLVQALGGAERSLVGWVKEQLGGLAMRIASRKISDRRGAVTDAAYPAAGDILLYQVRGRQIRDFIRQCIAQAPQPRVVVAHSLGGIACVDLLIEDPIDIHLLATVGSQAPFLYEINALQTLAYGSALPAHFPRWLNIYDLRDFLSYVGEEVFTGRVKDVEVDNRQPFPISHSAYWWNPAVWNAIRDEIP